ncbi:MAG: cell division protein FtsQ/DivIB [Gammaproteobacteria bacterium]
MARTKHKRARRRKPSTLSRTLSGIPWRAVGLVVMAAVLFESGFWTVRWLRNPHTLPLRTVRIEGNLRHLSAARLQKVVAPVATGGFFNVNVDAVRRAAQSLPWVESASVRRVWPDTLQLKVVEQKPIARWNKDSLINTQGAVFTPAAKTVPTGLPQLKGPAGLEPAVLKQYRAMDKALAPLGLTIAQLVEDQRRAWALRLSNGVELKLGRGETFPRLLRFVRIYPAVLAGHVSRLVSVDMRYSNGFAVRWDQRESALAVRKAEG